MDSTQPAELPWYIALLIDHQPRTQEVTGSNPNQGSFKNNWLLWVYAFALPSHGLPSRSVYHSNNIIIAFLCLCWYQEDGWGPCTYCTHLSQNTFCSLELRLIRLDTLVYNFCTKCIHMYMYIQHSCTL